jgi:hypothetical protein
MGGQSCCPAPLCMPVLPMSENLANCSRLAWTTPWRGREGSPKGGHFGTQTLKFEPRRFPLHRPGSPSKSLGRLCRETMGGQSCCPWAPLCMPVLPMSENLGNHCWLALFSFVTSQVSQGRRNGEICEFFASYKHWDSQTNCLQVP